MGWGAFRFVFVYLSLERDEREQYRDGDTERRTDDEAQPDEGDQHLQKQKQTEINKNAYILLLCQVNIEA